jgi:predicted phosphoribosyltransferase
VDAVTATERRELERRERLYRGGAPLPDVRGRTAILVDDGLATGSTMYAAVEALRQLRPDQIIVASPVAAPTTCDLLHTVADECVCVLRPEPFVSVGAWYLDFPQTTDAEVRGLLSAAARAPSRAAMAESPAGRPADSPAGLTAEPPAVSAGAGTDDEC